MRLDTKKLTNHMLGLCYLFSGPKLTRLTFNCAYLRLTKESQINEIGEKGGKYLEKKKLFVAKEKKKGEGKEKY